jgi:hypothetical protein
MYEAPELEIVGPASDLIQDFYGPLTDGGLFARSHLAISSALEEDDSDRLRRDFEEKELNE